MKIASVDDYLANGCGRCARFATPDCSTRRWLPGLVSLRLICQDAGLVETLKWSHPCYTHSSRNIVVIGAFRADFRLSFFNAALMKDPHGVLERQGPNTKHPDMIRFVSNEQVARLEPIIRSYLGEAVEYAEMRIVPPKDDTDPELPIELAEALEGDPELAAAFRKLTPGRRKSYIFNLNSAKQSSTRTSRIARFRSRIIAGKGALER